MHGRLSQVLQRLPLAAQAFALHLISTELEHRCQRCAIEHADSRHVLTANHNGSMLKAPTAALKRKQMSWTGCRDRLECASGAAAQELAAALFALLHASASAAAAAVSRQGEEAQAAIDALDSCLKVLPVTPPCMVLWGMLPSAAMSQAAFLELGKPAFSPPQLAQQTNVAMCAEQHRAKPALRLAELLLHQAACVCARVPFHDV